MRTILNTALIGSLLTAGGQAAAQVIGLPRDRAVVRSSEFEPTIEVLGPAYGVPSSPNTVRFLLSQVNRQDGTVTHQLRLTDSYHAVGARSWNRANDEKATVLDVVVMRTEVRGCTRGGECEYVEDLALTVSDSALRQSGQTGYRVKLYSETGLDLVVAITVSQINAQLAVVDSVVRRVRARDR